MTRAFTCGRSVVWLVLVGSGSLIRGVNQFPVLRLSSALSCHPPRSWPFPSGSSYSAWFSHWWRGTEYTLPRSRRRLVGASLTLLHMTWLGSTGSHISVGPVHPEGEHMPPPQPFWPCVVSAAECYLSAV